MITVIGVRFRTAGKIYYFDPAGRKVKTGDHVIVETARGIEYGYVVLGNREVDESKVVPPLKPVIRMATAEDEAVETKNKNKEKEAFKICQDKIKKHNLEMKLIDAEYTFDNNKVLFYLSLIHISRMILKSYRWIMLPDIRHLSQEKAIFWQP